MNKVVRCITLIFFLFVGALFCAYQNNWLIICLPNIEQKKHVSDIVISTLEKKVTLTWWHADAWHTESATLMWPTDKNSALQILAQAWLTLLDEEKLITKPVVLQSAMFSLHDKIAYLSFDRSPLNKQDSIYDKLRWVDGLSKTIIGNGLSCTHIQLLVHHKPLLDTHLDFSRPWPIEGFIDNR